MDDADLRDIADSLDDATRGKKSQSQITQGIPSLWLSANRAGCLRIAAALLRVASQPIPAGETEVTQPISELDQIVNADSDHEIFLIRRVETLAENPLETAPASNLSDQLTLLGCGLGTVVVLFLVATGIWFWGRFIFW